MMGSYDFDFPIFQQKEFFEKYAGPAAFLLWDGKCVQFIRGNEAYLAELELGSPIQEGTDLLTVLDESSRAAYRQAVEDAVRVNREQSCESLRQVFSQCCGASDIWVTTKLSPIGNTPEGWLLYASVRNITREKEQMNAIAEDEQRYRYAFEQANVYAWEYTIATKEMRPCYRCMRDLGLPPVVENYPEPAIEQGIFPQDYADMYREWHRKLESGVEHLEDIIPLTPARVPFHVRYTTEFDSSGRPIKAYGSATQVVGSEKEREYREIISCLGNVYFCLYYLDIDSGVYRELDIPSLGAVGEVIEKRGNAAEAFLQMSKHLVAPEQAEEMLQFTDVTTLADRLEKRSTVGIHFFGPHVGWCEGIFVAAQRDEQGRCTHALWGVRSIQQQKEKEERQKKELEAALATTEEALQEAKKANAARNTFLSRMSHDIRTPLNGIVGLLEIDERHADDRELINTNREKMRVAANHLLALVSDVLELSKMDDKNVKLADEAFDIRKLSEDVGTIADLRAVEKGITLHRADPDAFEKYPYVFGSPLHVQQLLLNIVGNAVKYNRPGGSVTCTVAVAQVTEQTVCYTFTIADTGIGMSPEFVKRIYEPFSQERSDARSVYQGTGLGMSIVKSLVDKMNGTIDVQSKPDLGTTFVVTIPFRIACEEDMPRAEENKAEDISGARVLLAEDNLLNMEIAVTLLEDVGVIVSEARNGQEAVELYKANGPDSYDLILMDLMMPVMDGFAATEKIRSMPAPYCDIPIVAMTANAFSDDVQRCLAAGMNDHLAKPLDMEKVISVIARYKS